MARKRQKAGYIDGFVLVVPKRKVAAYRKLSSQAGKVWMKHGALDYKECMGDDLRPNMGGSSPTLTFPKMTRLKPGETVFFSFIVYKSRAHRDAVNRKVMKDPYMTQEQSEPMPFDMKRMAYAGLRILVGA